MATRMLRNILGQGCKNINRKCCKRYLCSSREAGGNADIPMKNVPLSSRPPNFPPPRYAVADKTQHETQVTVLDNGLRVASENKFGEFCTVGVLIDSGSRYEVNYPSGINHFLEKLAFSKTTNYENRDKINQVLEKVGGICDCQSSRDTMIYAMSLEREGLPEALDILSDVVYQPVIGDEEIEMARQAIGFELESLRMNPDPTALMVEMIFAAGYRNNTLGLPKICPAGNLSKIDNRLLYTYMNSYYDPKRVVLAGVGIDHDTLVNMAEKHFVTKSPIWTENKSLIYPSKGMDCSIAQYTGGLVTEEQDLSDVSLGPNPMPELAHLVIGLESCSHRDDDFVTFCVLMNLLGGGGSFSAGGPGKGMYTRLYLNVLNKHHWIEMRRLQITLLPDTGMFLDKLTEVITKELVNTAGQTPQSYKEQLLVYAVDELGHKFPVVFEDCRAEKVTAEDISRVAQKMLRTKPAVAGYGTLQKLPDLDTIQNLILNKSKPKLFSLFGR
ncbi:mitochondrial-processing peptidase subunit alpha-like [Ruditapes philippinarum]|uniref:mitochondrial-processing peptidase subunit alpha-like n=1 Tax=Ruditapes philippinarum TaxID=129788 RepID=UPI00295A6386|nr:mitochondrial-processing peptidase subunit alpha-like [Ruditapes philippinarum]